MKNEKIIYAYKERKNKKSGYWEYSDLDGSYITKLKYDGKGSFPEEKNFYIKDGSLKIEKVAELILPVFGRKNGGTGEGNSSTFEGKAELNSAFFKPFS